MVRKMLRILFGLNPILLDAERRTKQLQATLNSEHDWLLLCRPTTDKEIKCYHTNQVYVKKNDV